MKKHNVWLASFLLSPILIYNINLKTLPMTEPKDLPPCPKCNSEFTYEDRGIFVCPECAHEWEVDEAIAINEDAILIKDSNGNTLNDGDSVTVIKDLKIKGPSSVVKVGSKVKKIRLVEGDHDIDCKIDGIGGMKLKSVFVKKG